MRKKIVLNQTISEVARCVASAEQKVREDINEYLGTLSESDITFHFRSRLSEILKTSSSEGRIADAFTNDLQCFLNDESLEIRYFDNPRSVAQGLIASATWHPEQTEGKITGGDFGLVVAQPEVQLLADSIQIDSLQNRSGVLTQAKLKRFQSKWGELTSAQERLLPDREEFLNLLRYEYSGADNRLLLPFAWSVCKGYKIRDVKQWLSKDLFPQTSTSAEVIKALAKGIIGTKDKMMIDTIICPKSGSKLIIQIDWKGGKPPKNHVNTWHKYQVFDAERAQVRA